VLRIHVFARSKDARFAARAVEPELVAGADHASGKFLSIYGSLPGTPREGKF
jgi:hypothetical protein